jgi:hypothetical protein
MAVAASGHLYPRVTEIVFGLVHDGLVLFLRLHVWADGGHEALFEVGLFRLVEPSADLGVIPLPLFLILHLAKQELAFELLARDFLDELHQARFCLHEGVELGVDLRVDFELPRHLLGRFGFCYCHRSSDFGARCFGIGPVTVRFDGLSFWKNLLGRKLGNVRQGFVRVVVGDIASERPDLLHDGFEEALGDLAGGEP